MGQVPISSCRVDSEDALSSDDVVSGPRTVPDTSNPGAECVPARGGLATAKEHRA